MAISCQLCSLEFSDHTGVLDHYFFSHTKGPKCYQCPSTDCSQYFRSFFKLKRHYHRIHSKAPARHVILNSQIVCVHCKENIKTDRTAVLSHLYHHLKSGNEIDCPVLDCNKTFTKKGSFRSHIHRIHYNWNDFTIKTSYISKSENESVVSDTDDSGFGISDYSVESDNESEEATEENFQNVTLQDAKDFLINLAVKYETQFNMSKVAVAELFSDIAQLAKFNRLIENPENKCRSVLEKLVSKECRLSTDHLRLQYVKTRFKETFVEPNEVALPNGQKAVYISILKTLLALFTHDDVVKDFETEQRTTDCKKIDSFWDSKFMNHLRTNDPNILLNIYMDEVQLTDPLGASKLKQKMTGVYFTLLNILPEHRSVLHTIQPCLLFNSKILKIVGMDQVLEPLINDLSKLYSEGIFIPKLGRIVKGYVAYISGDNLSQNDLAGFTCSFGAAKLQACRYCTIRKKNIKKGLTAGRTRFRGNYEKQLEAFVNNKEKQAHGIKKKCPFDTPLLPYFKVMRSFPPDPMHDLLEGVVPYEISLVLIDLISKKIITKNDILTRVEKFNYKGRDKTNKPVLSSYFEKTKRTGGNASTNWSFLRTFPLIFGSIIPNNYLPFEMLMVLKQIVEISFAPIQTMQQIQTLQDIVDVHRELRLQLFPQSIFSIKVHNLEHYADMIECFGPLANTATFRFEAKHSYFKRVVKNSRSFVNPFLHAANKHSLFLRFNLSGPQFFTNENSSKLEILDADELPENISLLLSSIAKRSIIYAYKFYQRNGIKYQRSDCVVLRKTCQFFHVGIIEHVVSIKNVLYVICTTFEALLNERLRIYELHSISETELVKISDLSYPFTLSVYKNVSNISVISLIHAVPSKD